MKLLVATDAHIFKTPDGKYWSSAIYGYSFWTRYLHVFKSVRIVARVKAVTEKDPKWLAVDGNGVEVFGIPFYQGPKALLRQYIKIHNTLRSAYDGIDAALFRMPSQTAYMAYTHIPKGMPFAGEVVYDPYEDKQNAEGIINRLLMSRISSQLSGFCVKANGVSYVTENSIQTHYPSYACLHGEDKEHFETYYSTITLKEDAFTAERNYDNISSLKIALSCVTMNNERKGEKTLIRVVKKVRDRGYDVSAVLIGDGTLRRSFEEYAVSLGVKDYITFTGLLPSSDEVRKVMLEADMFVFPTQGEGLPRGILEAMAIGMPVLSTPVGGIPEVIDRKYLFDPTDDDAFADEICHLLDTPDELTRMSKTNYLKSLEYKDDVLQKKRDCFYERLANLVRR